MPTFTKIMTKNPVFRVSGLPAQQPDDELKAMLTTEINKRLTEHERSTADVEVAIVPACSDQRRKVALVEFGGDWPHFLRELLDGTKDVWPLKVTPKRYYNFDCEFSGFTQLYKTATDAVTADVVAITGLGGHAYGSWRSRSNLRQMWLRDFLSEDHPNCRTMTYGYDSKLLGKGTGKIMDFSRTFIEELKKVRNKDQQRPLFFIAHSFGGIILAYCLSHAAARSNMDNNAALHAIYQATYSIFFFGTPHKGMGVDNFRRMMGKNDNGRDALLDDIKKKSSVLEHLQDDFRNIIRERKIVSFYELNQTQQADYDHENQRWARTGHYDTAVETQSALLQLPDAIEEKIPLDGDHSTMVKFNADTDAGYTSVLGRLQQYEREAPSVVEGRFVHAVRTATKRPCDTHWMVPRAVNSLFTGRTELIQRITSALRDDGASNSIRKQLVITGMGGIGKSEVCLQVANALRPDFWGVFWVDVSSEATAKNGFIAVSKMLGSPVDNIEGVLSVLASAQERWLLILDNADDDKTDFKRYIPSGTRGTLIITSRVSDCSQHSTVPAESLKALEEQPSMQLLLKAAQVQEDQWQRYEKPAQEIVHLLEFHTLALIQAGAYIAKGYCEMHEYPEKYELHRKQLLEHYPRQEQSRYQHVYATFEASAERLMRDEAGLDALELLSILGTLSTSMLPLQLFEEAWHEGRRLLKEHNEQHNEERIEEHVIAYYLPKFVDVKAAEWNDRRLTEASTLLDSLFLVTRSSTDGASDLSMHVLTHAWARDRLQAQQQQQAWVSAGSLLALSTGKTKTWQMWERGVRLHLLSLLAPEAEDVVTWGPRMHMFIILLRCGWTLHNLREDDWLMNLAYDIREELMFERYLMIQASFRQLAGRNALCRREFDESIGWFFGLVEMLTAEGKETLSNHIIEAQHLLAAAYRDNHDFDEALDLLEHLLHVRRSTLPEYHPDLLRSKIALALAYHADEQKEEARDLVEDVLEVCNTRMEEIVPEQLDLQYTVGFASGVVGLTQEAVEMLEHVVNARMTALPEHHSDVLCSQHELAKAYAANGHREQGIELMEGVIAAREQILSADHPWLRHSKEELWMMKYHQLPVIVAVHTWQGNGYII
ncbi:hypothetical protein BU24DRAFT_496047 [Aaosphaeria arxii CBS 175.79]|uniref:NB-ARC domain-containing protein n=1 Tax=Aaosphaeria arxii CBS 175.79 TaxID=1450172 RepID=A0A6A5XD07_9PLEO|nr:uncharacterized protein BU24DRAFT_496047 [Aaosphaeria arxii CBS 175.79]KAF2010868.1 hypothetical protein BU24DRAFT_496047 [Aaosphaeria arxii CBS 175.79]